MCGILVYYGKDKLNKEHPSLEVIKHRGPDNVGVKNFTLGQNELTLGHRRLSILDLSNSAHQPMNYINTDLWITFNGEIYNYKSLKKELEREGYNFVTQSDTEVLLAAYYKWGEECLNRFNGMFSFAIWDNSKKTLFVARDRYGIKPAYFWNSSKGFSISSEIKQLAELNYFERKMNYDVVYQFLEHGIFSYDSNTMWKDVFELEPGSCFTIDFNKWKMGTPFKIKEWYTPSFISNKRELISEDEACEQFKNLFQESLIKRLHADVNVGALISGGLDSSAIVSLATKNQLVSSPLNTYSIIYKEKKFSEDKYINIVNKDLGLKAKSYTFNHLNYIENMDKTIWYNDLPTTGRSIFSHAFLYQNIDSNQNKVILEGQGADEYLGGYGSFHIAYMLECLKKMKLIEFYKEYQGFKKTRVGSLQSDIRSFIRYGFPKAYKLLKKSNDYSEFFKLPKVAISKINRQQNNVELIYKTRFQILRGILHSVDRASMSGSIETRVPFLDHKLVEYTLALPFNYKIRNGIRKYILRESMKNVLPKAIYNRMDKMGFSSPEEIWIKNELKDFFKLELKEATSLPFLDSKKINAHFENFSNKDISLNKSLIRLINLNRWIKIFNISY